MKNRFSLIKLFLVVAIIYIAAGWCIGMLYARKPIIFGPYTDIPVAVKADLLGSSLEDISGSKAIMMVVPARKIIKDKDTAYFTRRGYFEVPGTWKFDYVSRNGTKKTFDFTGSFSRAICHDSHYEGRGLGSLSIEELNDFLIHSGRFNDVKRLRPYLALSRFEKKYPWAYSGSVLLSNAMGNTFKDNAFPYDVLGLVGIGVFIIAILLGSFSLWMCYLSWVISYWFARIGYHNPMLALSREGWQLIQWSFWHGFILKEGRLCIIFLAVFSAFAFGVEGLFYLVKHILPRKFRQVEDFLKVDRDAPKRKELAMETVDFKEVHYS